MIEPDNEVLPENGWKPASKRDVLTMIFIAGGWLLVVAVLAGLMVARGCK